MIIKYTDLVSTTSEITKYFNVERGANKMSEELLDLMESQFDSRREAYAEGRKDGEYSALKLAILIASTVGSECESASNDAGFHASEEIVRRIMAIIEKRP